MANVKHNKIKNTGIIFEVLVRQIASDLLDDKSNSVAIKIIKEFFKKNTELNKELRLYQHLIKENFKSDVKAMSFIDTVVNVRRDNINNKKLKKEKYEVLKKIKENFDVNKLFSCRIDHYPVYASIYKLFEYADKNEIKNPSDLANSKFTVLEHLIRQNNKVENNNLNDGYLNTLRKYPLDVRVLTQRIIMDNFNREFGNKLSDEQRDLMRYYISNISNAKLKFIRDKVEKIENKLIELSNKIKDDAVKIKLNEVISLVAKVKRKKFVNDRHILGLLKIYSLIDELESNIKNKKI